MDATPCSNDDDDAWLLAWFGTWCGRRDVLGRQWPGWGLLLGPCEVSVEGGRPSRPPVRTIITALGLKVKENASRIHGVLAWDEEFYLTQIVTQEVTLFWSWSWVASDLVLRAGWENVKEKKWGGGNRSNFVPTRTSRRRVLTSWSPTSPYLRLWVLRECSPRCRWTWPPFAGWGRPWTPLSVRRWPTWRECGSTTAYIHLKWIH